MYVVAVVVHGGMYSKQEGGGVWLITLRLIGIKTML